MNVSCNIFINSFGSIAETTMVSESKYKLLLPAGEMSVPEIVILCIGLPQGGRGSVFDCQVSVVNHRAPVLSLSYSKLWVKRQHVEMDKR